MTLRAPLSVASASVSGPSASAIDRTDPPDIATAFKASSERIAYSRASFASIALPSTCSRKPRTAAIIAASSPAATIDIAATSSRTTSLASPESKAEAIATSGVALVSAELRVAAWAAPMAAALPRTTIRSTPALPRMPTSASAKSAPPGSTVYPAFDNAPAA